MSNRICKILRGNGIARFDIQNNRKWTKKRIFVNKQSNVYRTDYLCKNNFKRQDLPIVKIHLKFDNPYQSKLS